MNILDALYSLWFGERLPDASVESSKKDLAQMLEPALGKDQEEMFSDFLLEYVGQVERCSFSTGSRLAASYVKRSCRQKNCKRGTA